MSDFIDDIDQDLLGLFEDHQEIVSLSILSILNSLGPIQLMRNEYWQHTRIDTNDHFERRIHDDSFKRTYRMDFNSFLVLYDMLFPYIGHDIRFSRHGTPITKVMIVLAGLRYCAGATYDSIQDIIGTNPRVVYCLRDKFINAVLQCPSLKIELPQSTDHIMDGFASKSSEGIMNRCIGCIDGFFQATKAPGKKEVNYNQLGYYSGHYESYGLNCQAVCDHELRFTYFGVIGPGSMNDAVAFRLTGLKRILENAQEGTYMLGDAAYPIMEKLLIPYTGSQREDPFKDSFNFYLSQLRIRIEMAFGLLVQKWRILNRKLEMSIENNVKVLRVCASLHNFVIDHGVSTNEEATDTSGFTSTNSPSGFEYCPTRVEDREDLQSFLNDTERSDSVVRQVLVQFLQQNNIRRPEYNIQRNGSAVDSNDSDLEFYTTI